MTIGYADHFQPRAADIRYGGAYPAPTGAVPQQTARMSAQARLAVPVRLPAQAGAFVDLVGPSVVGPRRVRPWAQRGP